MGIQEILLGICLVSIAGHAAAPSPSDSPTLPAGGGPVITGISNNASGAPAIESGSWVSIYGTGLVRNHAVLAGVRLLRK